MMPSYLARHPDASGLRRPAPDRLQFGSSRLHVMQRTRCGRCPPPAHRPLAQARGACSREPVVHDPHRVRLMVSRPAWQGRRPGRVVGVLVTLRTQLTKQFITRNRRMAFTLSVAVIAIGGAAVHVSVWWFSPGVMILPILAGGLLMWPRALRIFFVFVAGALIYDLVEGKAGPGIVATIVLTAVFAYVLARTRKKLGVQGLRGDRMLLELRDRIQAQGKLPRLGEGWGSSAVLRPAGGSSFGGDFVVSFCDGKTLEVALGDVSGKGIDAGTRALLLSGAFGGLLGSVPPADFLPAANAYLRRGTPGEGFVTAVHVAVDLATGEFVVSSGGHPPAAHFEAGSGRW